MIDTHAHLYLSKTPVERLIHNANQAGISHIVSIGINLETSLKSLALSKKFDCVSATIGIHPGECQDICHIDEIETLAQSETFKAIGEIGLDYFKMYSPKERQQEVFITQLNLAEKLNLPIVIHNRHADDDILAILSDYPTIKKVFHCFSSGPEFIQNALEQSEKTLFSFTGMITYSKKGKTINSIRELPLDYIMLETDSPYLTPTSQKGQENQPAYLPEIAKKIAEIKNIPLEKVIEQTSNNAKKIFKLK